MSYQKISQNDKERLVECHVNGGDYVELAGVLGIKRKTAYSIIARYKATGCIIRRRGGNRHPKITDDMRTTCVEIIEENPNYTLDQINDELKRRLPDAAHICISTLGRILDGELITIKKLEDSPTERNSSSVKNQRRGYAEWLLQDGVNNQLIFIDEAGYNLHTKRTRGRARRGERAVRVVSGDRGPNLTVCFAVSPQLGLVHHTIDNGSMTSGKFQDFLREVSTRLGEAPTYFIFDNATCHSRAVTTAPQHYIQRLPPYSPFLNITEMAISAWKAEVKRHLAEVRDQLLNGPVPPGVSQRQHRMAILAQLGEQSVDTITTDKCRAWFRHTQGYLPRCLAMTDILQ